MISSMTHGEDIVSSMMTLDEQYQLNFQLLHERKLRQSAIENEVDSDEVTQVYTDKNIMKQDYIKSFFYARSNLV